MLDSYLNHNNYIHIHIHNNHINSYNIRHYDSRSKRNKCHKIPNKNYHSNRHSQSRTLLSSSNSNLFIIGVIFIARGFYIRVNGSILRRISSKIDSRNDRSCVCNLKTFILRFCTCCIDDNVMCLEKIKVVYFHSRLHDEVTNILRNIFFNIYCIWGQAPHLCQSSLNNFLKDTFFYLDATSPFRIVTIFYIFFLLIKATINTVDIIDLKAHYNLRKGIRQLQMH